MLRFAPLKFEETGALRGCYLRHWLAPIGVVTDVAVVLLEPLGIANEMPFWDCQWVRQVAFNRVVEGVANDLTKLFLSWLQLIVILFEYGFVYKLYVINECIYCR